MEEKELQQKWMKDLEISYDDGETIEEKTEFKNLFECEESQMFQEGELFPGKIINIGPDYVTIDIGFKQEGLVSIKEFQSFEGALKIKEGDVIEIYLECLESSSGHLVLSKDKAEILKAWDKISEACENGIPLKGTVIAKVKGGLSVDIGVKAFLPGSQIDLRPIRFLDKYIGKKMEFKVVKFNKKRGNIVLSRRAILQEERGKLRSEILSQIQEGMIVKGIVKNITDYGVFIDLGGIDGLLHITDMSWGRVKHPSNLLSIGDEVEVKILKFDAEKERVSLGLKQVQPNPWDRIQEKYSVGMELEGEVVSMKDYGIFIELSNGIEGLIHVSEMSWSGKITNPIKYFNLTENVKAKILDIDIENKRISLGIKQIMKNPWHELIEKYKKGTKVSGTIDSLTEFGVYLDLGEEVNGFIHISDISWTRQDICLEKEFLIGKKLEAIVLIVDKENYKFSLGLKQLEEDPWNKIEDRFPLARVFDGEITKVTDFGVFVALETGIAGLVDINEISEKKVEDPDYQIKVGDMLTVSVVSVDKDTQKIALSINVGLKTEFNTDNKDENIAKNTLTKKLKNFTID